MSYDRNVHIISDTELPMQPFSSLDNVTLQSLFAMKY